MDELGENLKIAYVKNLSKQNFNTVVSVPVDSNVNIKTILNVSSYLFDQKAECANGKAVVTGKIGVKVFYLDTDGITNTLTDTQTFNETILDSAITSNSFINVLDVFVVNSVLSSDGVLKLSCDVSFSPVVYLNLNIAKPNTFENMIVKKDEVTTNTLCGEVDTSFEYNLNLETKNNITKILCYNATFVLDSATPYDGYAVVEGKIYSKLIYECAQDSVSEIKELCDSFNVKSEVKIDGLDMDANLDLSVCVNPNKTNITTESEDGNYEVNISHDIRVCGVITKRVVLEVVDDMYSTDNELELSRTNREFVDSCACENLNEVVGGEFSLSDGESAIDEVVSNLEITPEITNTYVKDDCLVLEGVVSSQVIYLDEFKEYKQKMVELPFVVNTKVKAETNEGVHSSICVCDSKVKAKRGTILEFEYSVNLSVCVYTKHSHDMIDNITIGKPLNLGMYDYQIYLAKPNETMWELCKRIKISPDDISKYNKSLPLVMEGGEKVIIKR